MKDSLKHHRRYNQNTLSCFLKSGEYLDTHEVVHYDKKIENI